MSTSIYDMFKNMNLSVGEYSDKLALSWLNKHGNVFLGFENGRYLKIDTDVKEDSNDHKICAIFDNFNGKHLCDIYVPSYDSPGYKELLKRAANVTSQGFEKWSQMTPISRSKILLNIAQSIEKYQELFVNVEAVSSGKHLSKVKAKDVPNLIEGFNFYSCCVAQLEEGWKSIGPVCVVTEEYNNPCLNFSLRVSSILASGCSVLLLADVKSCLSSFLLAEICTKSGLPAGVLNVLPIDSSIPVSIEEFCLASKLIFTGSFERGLEYLKFRADSDVPVEFFFPRRPVIIVYETADLHSAAYGVLEALSSHDTRSESGGCKVMVQECIQENFLRILNDRFSKILLGHNLSKTDMSCIVTEKQKQVLTEYVEEAERFAKKTTLESHVDSEKWKYDHMMPTLLSTLPTNFKLVHKELGGPIVVTVPFRTVKESIAMFNCDNKGSPVNIWTDQISVAMEVALKLKTGVVWVDSESKYDVKTPFSGVYMSGNSVEGGKEALFHHMHPGYPDTDYLASDAYLTWSDKFDKPDSSIIAVTSDLKEYKLFIGGKFIRSNNGAIRYSEKIYIPSAIEGDVQNAVSSAVAAQPKWESFTDLQKRTIFFAVMDKLTKAKAELVSELLENLNTSVADCEDEINTALEFLFQSTQDLLVCKTVQDDQKNYFVVKKQYPLGVVAIQCPDKKPLLSLIVLIFSVIARGNTVVALCSASYPTIALKMCEIFSSVNIPGGVINIICGNYKRLIPALCWNSNVNALWFTDVPSKVMYSYSRNPFQQLYCCNEILIMFLRRIQFYKASNKCDSKCTFTKSIFLPVGDIFAN